MRDTETKDSPSCSWGYIHTALFVMGILTFGFLDAFTAALMMEKFGAGAEFNPLMRVLFLTRGMAGFITFKVLTAVLILSVPFLLYKREGMHWTTAGFLSVFAVSEAVAAMNNYIFLMSGLVWVEPGIMALTVLLAVAAVL